jgi:hypothetical protein
MPQNNIREYRWVSNHATDAEVTALHDAGWRACERQFDAPLHHAEYSVLMVRDVEEDE